MTCPHCGAPPHKQRLSPLAIQILLECYASSDPGVNILPSIWNSASAGLARSYLSDVGYVDPITLRTTERGKAYVEKLCTVPFT